MTLESQWKTKENKKTAQRQERLEDMSRRMNRPQQGSETVTSDLCRWSRGTQKNEKRGGGNETDLGKRSHGQRKDPTSALGRTRDRRPKPRNDGTETGRSWIEHGKTKAGTRCWVHSTQEKIFEEYGLEQQTETRANQSQSQPERRPAAARKIGNK
jgi:hypothetical protein